MASEEIEIDDVQANVIAALQEEVTDEVIADVEETEVVDEVVVEEEIEKEPQFTQTELEAKEYGWNPEGSDKDGNKLTAEEFLGRKPLFNKIGNQGKQIDTLKTQLDQVIEQNKQIAEQNKQIAASKIEEREKYMKQLAAAKESALTDLDVNKVRALDTEIDSVREELAEKPADTPAASEEITPAYQAFVDENEWAKDETSALYVTAMDVAERFVAKQQKAGIAVTEKEVYDHAANQIKDLYPHKFQVEPAARAAKVGNNNHRTSVTPVKTKKTINDIPEDQRALAKEVMESTGLTEDEYLTMYS